MSAFLIYDVKVAAALLVFYLFYRFLLKKETFHRFNRVVLVGTAVLSFLLPLCIITVRRPLETAQMVTEPAELSGLPLQELQPLAQQGLPWWPVALAVVFWGGVALVLARVVVSILSIVRIIRRGGTVLEEDGCRIIVTERDIDPFSWMKYIVLSRKDWELPHGSILAHEKAHIAYGHSVEVLLVDVLSAFQWFNPAIWMLRADLQELHEYEADDAVLRTGADIKEYQYLLIRKAVSKSGYSVANSFNHSILKNRITMMSKSKSPLARGLRVLGLLPLVCLGLVLQAKTVYVPVDKDSEIISESGIPDETMPKFNGGSLEEFSKWVAEHLKYPSESIAQKVEGRVVVGFTVSETGDVTEVKILRGVSSELDAEALRVVSESPRWAPGIADGKPVSVQMTFPIVFKLNGAQSSEGSVVLNVRSDSSVEVGGKVVQAKEIAEYLRSLGLNGQGVTVYIDAAAGTPMAVIEDLKNELRKIEALKVSYRKPSETAAATRQIKPSLDRKTKVETYDQAMAGIDRDDVCVVRINSNDRVFFGNGAFDNADEILRIGKAFLKEHGAKTCFMLGCDRGTSFGAYQKIQALLNQIYVEVRAETPAHAAGDALSDLSEDEFSAIQGLYPISVLEIQMKG